MVTAEELIMELPKGLIKWYGFEEGKKALYISAGTELDHSLFHALKESVADTECITSDDLNICKSNEYDYIVMSSAIETTVNGEELLVKVKNLIEKSGKLFIITDNRLAVRYFCGDKDPYTGRNFDGVENYKNALDVTGKIPDGRLYSKAEIKDMLNNAGFAYHKFYSVFPEITCPQMLISEEYKPNEELDIRLFPRYYNPDIIFIAEEGLYSQFMANDLLHPMANGFLIECPMDGVFSNAQQITVSMERGRENAMCTIVGNNDTVIKKPLYEEGSLKLERLIDNNRYLGAHGVRMVPAEIRGNEFVMPYVWGTSIAAYLRVLARKDKEALLRQYDRLWEIILNSSEHVPYDDVEWEYLWWNSEEETVGRGERGRTAYGAVEDKENFGPILKRGYIDLVILNGFIVDGEYIFYGQEAYVENLPAKAIMQRNITLLFRGEPELERYITMSELLGRYKIEKYSGIYSAYIRNFLTKLRNDDILNGFHAVHRQKSDAISQNRGRMNFPAADYRRLFIDIFCNTEKRKIILFGAGRYTAQFIELYRHEFQICCIADNNKAKWGQDYMGIRIESPNILYNINENEYKVIICIKKYIPVAEQLNSIGLKDYSIYDPVMDYPRKRWLKRETDRAQKKYHVGYVAGVFDLFHIGHLNLLRSAKEQCDYLIAGVVNDERAERIKNKKPFIPFKERLEIVGACKYVDEAVEIPTNFGNTRDAYAIYHFDCMFTGDDHADSPHWQGEKKFLEEHGAEMIFFPYTQGTSSTMLQGLILADIEKDNKKVTARESGEK